MKIPTQKRLIVAFGPEKGTAIYRLASGSEDCREHPAVVAWANQCYHDPRSSSRAYPECLLLAINAVLEGHGTEPIEGRYVDRYHQNVQAEYVNMGDTYNTTILIDHETDRMLITSWGDWVEKYGDKREVA